MSFPLDPGYGDPLQRLPSLSPDGHIQEPLLPYNPIPYTPGVGRHAVDENIYEVKEVLNKPIELVVRVPFKNKDGVDCALIITEAEAYKLYESLGAVLRIK